MAKDKYNELTIQYKIWHFAHKHLSSNILDPRVKFISAFESCNSHIISCIYHFMCVEKITLSLKTPYSKIEIITPKLFQNDFFLSQKFTFKIIILKLLSYNICPSPH